MSRTVDLWTPTVRTRNSPGGFLLTPSNVRRAVNTGRQLANAANQVYNSVSNLVRSPRIAAGSIPQQQMVRSIRNSNYRRARGRRSRRPRMRRQYRRNRRGRGRTSLARKINRQKRGTNSLMRRAKSENNAKYHYDNVHFGDVLEGSFNYKTTKIFTAAASDFPALSQYAATAPLTNNVTPFYREFRIRKVWIKIHPKRAHFLRNGTNTPEVKDREFSYLICWPLSHTRASNASVNNISDYRLQTDPAPKKFISFNKMKATIMSHGAFYEEATTLSGPDNPTIYKPTKYMPWMEFSELGKIRFGSFAAQLPHFHSKDPPNDERELPKFTFSIHIIFEMRSRANTIAEITN